MSHLCLILSLINSVHFKQVIKHTGHNGPHTIKDLSEKAASCSDSLRKTKKRIDDTVQKLSAKAQQANESREEAKKKSLLLQQQVSIINMAKALNLHIYCRRPKFVHTILSYNIHMVGEFRCAAKLCKISIALILRGQSWRKMFNCKASKHGVKLPRKKVLISKMLNSAFWCDLNLGYDPIDNAIYINETSFCP